ncbi:MAG: hypothetical protein QXL51_04730 [Candidatus Aenigmatarchaeota archaeon]
MGKYKRVFHKGVCGGVGMPENVITLYPSNWLYNAGVIGFLEVLEMCGETVENLLRDDGSVCFEKSLFKKIDTNRLYFSENKIARIIGKSSLYRNYLQKTWKPAFEAFVNNLENLNLFSSCDICSEGKYLDQNIFNSSSINNLIVKFINGIRTYDVRLNYYLAPSKKKFPNSFWNNNTSLVVCDLCGYILIHHHIPMVKISGDSEIFINCPSFKLMWHLNKYVKEIYTKEVIVEVKKILGMSLIELASKLYINLGRWEKMNIEVVCKYKMRKNEKEEDKIEFFSLPAEIVDLISDRAIANIINEIGEFKILNMVLDGRLKDILSFGEKIFKIGLKPENERGKHETDFINSEIRLERNRRNLINFSQKIFNLLALIESKKGGSYEF